ncbi:hypothetical protein J4Q44_G00393310, partial [Coregonus suidteri]
MATHSLPFEFRALEAILQHRVNILQARLNEVHPVILDILESLVDPKLLSADRSKLHILLQNRKNLSELETDIKVFKDSLLKILDEEEMIEELCVTKWTDPRVFEESSLGIDHAEEMELLLENYFMQAEELGNTTRELKGLIDDSESVIFINFNRTMTQHTSRLSKCYFTKKESDGVLHQMTWPPQSPDLNQNEMVWDESDRRVKEKQPTSAQHT